MATDRHILVVDDDEGMVLLLSSSLGSAGCRISVAANGVEALQMIKEASEKGEAIDLMLLDIQMPEMSGVELMQELKKLGLDFPVLIMTAFAEGTARHELEDMGYTDIIVKPFTRDTLLGRISEILSAL